MGKKGEKSLLTQIKLSFFLEDGWWSNSVIREVGGLLQAPSIICCKKKKPQRQIVDAHRRLRRKTRLGWQQEPLENN